MTRELCSGRGRRDHHPSHGGTGGGGDWFYWSCAVRHHKVGRPIQENCQQHKATPSLFNHCLILIKCGAQDCTVCSRCGRTKGLYNRRISSLFLYLKLREMNPCTLLVVLLIFSVCFGHLFQIPLLICFEQLLIGLVLVALHCCCVRCAWQKIYQYWNSFDICLPTQHLSWYLPVVPLCHTDFRHCGKVWYHLQIYIFCWQYLYLYQLLYIIRNTSGPNTLMVVHQMWLLPICYRIGWHIWQRPANQFRIHLAASHWMSCALTCSISISCGTLSNTFGKFR